MSSKLNYRLALDLGTHSIGWAVLPLDENNKPKAIAKAGVRIFSDGRHPKTGTSLAVERRLARQMRRRRDRLLKRTKRMITQLVEFDFLPDTLDSRRQLATLNPYELRAKALDHALHPHEFGRIMLHLSKRRGFKSNRKTDKKDNDLGVMSLAIKTLEDKLETEHCRTLGEWLAKRHTQELSVRARLRGSKKSDKAYDFYANRTMTKHEFDTIWAKQCSLQPQLYTEKARLQLRDTLLFQRELLPAVPGRCTLIPDERRAPLALPSVQLVRILQELNNLRIIQPDQSERSLSLQERNLLKDLLCRQKNLSFSKIRTTLKLGKNIRFNLEGAKRSSLKGDLTASVLSAADAIGETYFDWPIDRQDQLVKLLLDEASETSLTEKLDAQFKLSASQASILSNTQTPEGYGRLSEAAIKLILPELNDDVITYAEAVELSGLGSHSALTNMEKTGELLQSLPYYGVPLQRHVAFEKDNPKSDEERFGKIANPTVHICLNQLRVVVNTLIRRYGLPEQVHVEVTRALKLSKARKEEIDKQQAERQKRTDLYLEDACKVLNIDPDMLDRSKRREISKKMQLWYELNPKDCSSRQCPFSGEQISIRRLLSEEIEIEHILPFSRTLDDSMANKTLATVQANRAKSNQTPWEAFGDGKHPDYNYDDILRRAGLLPINKSRRFSRNGLANWEGKNGFLARALTDTAYISKLARDYLSCICLPHNVLAIPGQLTALIRGKLGLNDLITDNNGKKNREDHRHHAIDAIVIGVTERSFLAAVAKANSRAANAGSSRLIEEMPLPWPTFLAQTSRAVQQITASHRPDHGYQGGMMEDTARRVLEAKNTVIRISDKHMAHRHGLNEDGSPKPYKSYIGGSNYCVEIYEEKNKWKGDVVSTFQAYQIIRQFGEAAGLRRLRDRRKTLKGKPLIMRLMINDFVMMKHLEKRQIFRLASVRTSGELSFSKPNEANVAARSSDKSLPYISKRASSLQKADAVCCTVSPIGNIKSHRSSKKSCLAES